MITSSSRPSRPSRPSRDVYFWKNMSILLLALNVCLINVIFSTRVFSNECKKENQYNEASYIKPQTLESITTKANTHWCVISQMYISFYSVKYFQHFPHSVETVLPCWSYFHEHNLRENCGIELRLGDNTKAPPYVIQLIEDVMKCKILSDDNPRQKNDTSFIPNLYHMRPRYQGIRFLNSFEHAQALRRNIISDEDIARVKGEGKPLQIGIIQRPDSRRIDNLEDIRDALVAALPDAEINLTDFNFTSIREQAWYFASKDIIIGAHGAAMVNSMFIQPKTIVLQMHVTGYFYQFFEGLIEQSGGIAVDWHNKTAGDPYINYMTIANSDIPKNSKFLVPPEDIVERVLFSTGKKMPSRDDLNQMYGNVWAL